MANDKKQDTLREEALAYHKNPKPGKIAIVPTTDLATQRDLALAYSPGVAIPCEEIAANPDTARDYTARGNLVAVISNGTAVLGLGNIGPLASKPVMEGKSVLFKKFANIDSMDIEIDELDPDKFVETVARLEPTFGGINLEDIKSPECFEIEEKLRARMNIPVFHDDQHGTAIIVTAAFTNWIKYSGRDINDIKLVASGAGASAIACLKLLHHAGLKKENIIICDRNGVVYKGRNEGMSHIKEQFANDTDARTVSDAIKGADVFLGLSGPGAITKEDVASMADAPLIMTLANPTPEIMPEEVAEAKPDAIVCTGRSDYPNQVNNVLCFPFIFRGALDVGATTINEEMKLACVEAIAALARKEATAEVASVYSNERLSFGPTYLIPKPFDPRLIEDLPLAVAKTAMETGVATRPIEDFEAYKNKLKEYFVRTQLVMRPIFTRAKQDPKRVVYTEGEEVRILQAVQTVLDENLAKPILIGRHKVIQDRIETLGLRMRINEDFELVDPDDDPRYREYWESYYKIMERKGVTPAIAKTKLRSNTTLIGALMVKKGEADSMVCGTVGLYHKHLKNIVDVIGLKPGVETPATMTGVLISKGPYFFTDTHSNQNPSAEQMAEMTILAAQEVERFGIKPKVAMLSHSNFGSCDCESSSKTRIACEEVKRRAPNLEIDGEMQADTALSQEVRDMLMPNSTLKGAANLFVMPNVEAANIAYNMLKVLGSGVPIGPLLLGAAQPVHIMTHAATARGIVNISAIATVSAQAHAEETTPAEMTKKTA